MSERTRNLLSITAMALMAVVIVTLVVSNPSQADRVEQIGTRIKCPVCQGESIANSPAQMARDMMSLVSERVSQGAPDDEIIGELLSSYSGAVLLDPPASGETLVLWVAPLVVVVIGISVIIWWRRHPGTDQPAVETNPEHRPRARSLIGGLILVGAFAIAVVTAGFFLQDRGGPTAGVANLDGQDLSEISNETMEAVVSANLDNPQIDGMRLALAERYYEVGDYRSAFPHYIAIADSALASDSEAVTALVRLGWMAWDGNGEVEAAIGLFDQALIIEAGSTTAMYLKGQVLWCGAGDNEAAAALFSKVLKAPGLSGDSQAVVVLSLDSVSSGEPCT